MKKLTIALLLLGVGLFLSVNKVHASYPTDDYLGISYVTSSSSNAFISTTSLSYELIDLTVSNGNDVKTIVIIDSAPWKGITGVNTPGVSTSTLVGWSANAISYPMSQWASSPMIIHTATGSITGMNVYNLRGTVIKKGLNVFKDSDSRSEYWTIRFRPLNQ